jgi:hypothetical protein
MVYNIIYEHQPLTISEMIRYASNRVTNTGSFTGRISELQEMDLIYIHHEGPCPITGRNVIFWATTNNLPKKIERKMTKKEKVNFVLRDLKVLYKTCNAEQREIVQKAANMVNSI